MLGLWPSLLICLAAGLLSLKQLLPQQLAPCCSFRKGAFSAFCWMVYCSRDTNCSLQTGHGHKAAHRTCASMFSVVPSWLRSTDSSWSSIWRRSPSSCFSMSIGEQLFSSTRSSVCSLCRCCSCAAFKVGGASLPKPEKAFI